MQKSVDMGLAGSLTMIFLTVAVVLLLRNFYKRFNRLQKIKDEERKQRYIARHKKNEDWTKSGIDTPGFWAYRYLWSYPTKTQAYENIKKNYII
jgi:hypothetical protein